MQIVFGEINMVSMINTKDYIENMRHSKWPLYKMLSILNLDVIHFGADLLDQTCYIDRNRLIEAQTTHNRGGGHIFGFFKVRGCQSVY